MWDARLEPTQASEQQGVRPVVIVGRDVLNNTAGIVLSVPVSTFRPNRRIFANRTLLRAPDGGLDADSIALCEQLRALDRGRFLRRRGHLSNEAMAQIDTALMIALDLIEGRPSKR